MPSISPPAGLATITAAGQQPTVTFASVNAQLATVTASAGLAGASVTSNTFPAQRLGLRVDLLLGGVWTDITQYVYQRNPLQITNMGRADWTSTIQPGQLTLTVNDRDGRFTPKNSAGAYFPNITRNTQIRLFLSATSTSGATYAGFRFWGEVSEWPPLWDASGRDVAVNIVASGIWRRISQQQTTLGSAFRRYVDNLSSPAVQAYWPCEDGTGSGQIVPFGSPAGTANAVQQFVGGQAGLSFAASTAFPGSDEILQLNAASIIATVPAGGTPTNNAVRFGISVPLAGDSGSGSTNWNLVEIDTAGTVKKFELYLLPSGLLLMHGVDSTGSVIFAGTTTTNVKGQPYLVSMELTAGVNFALRLIKAGASGITESVTGSLGSGSVGAVTRIQVNRSFQLVDTAFGHLHVNYGSPTSMVAAATALGGNVGEKALDRFTRICAEQGIATETIGISSQSASLGPQVDDTIANVLQSIEDTDCGLLYETTDQFGLGYRTNASMLNQQAAVTLNYAAALIDPSLAPVYDDALTRNNVTLTNWTGFSQQAILTVGAMSILNPPSGIGNGYVYTRNVNAAQDTQLAGIASFLLNTGSVDEIRVPVVSIRMIRATSAPFFSSIANLGIGDYFQITNPPSFLRDVSSGPIKQLVWGYSETLNAKQWDFAFNAVPESPWETGFSPGTIQSAQIPGGSPVSSQAQGSLGLASLIANGSITPAMLSQGITTHTLGGNAVTIALAAPGNPNTGDIWINATTGLISNWNGSIWSPVLFNATSTIQAGTITSALILAGTIVAANIAANTISAAQLAAGIVYAGIVDATTIKAAQYVASGSSGEFLAYSGTPALGNLVTSISGMSGSDSFTNPYAQGIEIQSGGLTLDNQGSAPAATANASTFYSSVRGRPRYLSQSGDDSVVERSTVNVSQFTLGNTITSTVVSADLDYLANEGSQSSEFEIEIAGNGTGNNQTLTFHLYIDGIAVGTNFTLGATVFTYATGTSFAYTVRMLVSVLTSGGSGTIISSSYGIFKFDGNVVGSSTARGDFVNADISPSSAFDTTANHTIQIRANWGNTATSQTMTTYRTKLARRM